MPDPQPAPPDQLSPANRRAVDAVHRRLEERMLAAQQGGESGELEFVATVSLLRGQTRALRCRRDERLPIDFGGTPGAESPQ